MDTLDPLMHQLSLGCRTSKTGVLFQSKQYQGREETLYYPYSMWFIYISTTAKPCTIEHLTREDIQQTHQAVN